MKVIWQRGWVTVRDVYEEMLKRRRIAYTTVLTMMRILEEKGHLIKDASERAHRYRSARPEQQVRGDLVRDFLGRVFDGSAKPLLVHLLDDDALSREDLEFLEGQLKGKEDNER